MNIKLPNNLTAYIQKGGKSDYIKFNIDIYNSNKEVTMYMYTYSTGLWSATINDVPFVPVLH